MSVLLVVLNHFTIPLPGYLEFFRARGYLGVEFFFAVSGFLVMRSLHICIVKNKSNFSKAIKEFYVRRGSRIFFPYYSTLALLGCLSFFVESFHKKIVSISDILFSFPIYLYNYAKSYTDGDVPGALNIMWSLSFEEQFYILLGLVVFLFRKNINLALLVLCVGSIFVRFLSVEFMEDINFYRIQAETHMRLDSILWGSLLYLNFEKVSRLFKKRPLFNLLTVLGVLFSFYFGGLKGSNFYTAFTFLFSGIFFTVLIPVLLGGYSVFLSGLLSNKLLVMVGKVSYEIYLIHQIINAVLIKVGITSYPFIYGLCMFVVPVVCSIIIYKWVHLPVQNYLRQR